jgi:hypothetical protein
MASPGSFALLGKVMHGSWFLLPATRLGCQVTQSHQGTAWQAVLAGQQAQRNNPGDPAAVAPPGSAGSRSGLDRAGLDSQGSMLATAQVIEAASFRLCVKWMPRSPIQPWGLPGQPTARQQPTDPCECGPFLQVGQTATQPRHTVPASHHSPPMIDIHKRCNPSTAYKYRGAAPPPPSSSPRPLTNSPNK